MSKVTVVIPLYNHEQFVVKAVESVLAQTLDDLELIVVNDGSTDNSRKRLLGIQDRRLRVLDQSNQGAHAAINRGLSEATGDFLAILNSDDVYHPDRLEKLIPVLEANPNIGLVASYIEIIDQYGNNMGIKEGYKNMSPWPLEEEKRSFRVGSDLRATLLTENYLATTSNYVFSRTWYERVGGFRALRFVHDWDFALRVVPQAEVFLFPEPLMQYRVHATNTIRQNQAAMVFEICWILAVHLPQLVSSPWFNSNDDLTCLEGLYHSIYTFDCDRVLNILLLQRLPENPALAETLLQPENPQRMMILDWIASSLEKKKVPLPEKTHLGLRHWLVKLKRWMK